MKALEYLGRYSFISLAFLHQFFKIFWNKKYFEKEVFFSMQKFSLYVGLNDKTTKMQEITTIQAYKLITNIVASHKVDGFTVLEASGYYRHEDNSISIEKSLKIEFLFIDMEVIKQIIKDLKIALNQESIILQKENVSSEMI